MWDIHKVLIIALADVAFLLPVRIFPDNECAYSFRNKQIDDASACCVQVMVYSTSALVRDALHTSRETRIFEDALKVCLALVIILVDRLNWTPVNNPGEKSRFV